MCVLRQLLTASEHKELMRQDNSPARRLIIWAMQTIRETNIDPFERRHLVELVAKLRAALDTLWSFDDTPIPFVYYHLMNLLTFVVLTLRWFYDGVNDSTNFRTSEFSESPRELRSTAYLVTMTVVLFVANLLFNGLILSLKELAIMISDPLVNDNNAIPIERYMDLSLTAHSKLTNYHHTRPAASQDPGFATAHRLINPLSKRVEVDLKRRALRLRTRWRPVFKQASFEERKRAAKIVSKLGNTMRNLNWALDDKRMNEAAIKVQAAERGRRSRRRLSFMRNTDYDAASVWAEANGLTIVKPLRSRTLAPGRSSFLGSWSSSGSKVCPRQSR